MSSRFADPSTMRTRSPIYHDEGSKRPPPSPSNKAPPPKKLDAKSRPVSEEPGLSCKAPPGVTPSSELHAESCPDKPSSNRVVVDMDVFQQIFDLDDGDDREFSSGMVQDYLQQAEETIKSMDYFFAKHDLINLGKKGHYLKGSSAALGVVQVQEICEKIQHLGGRMDPDKPEVKISAEEAFAKIKPLLDQLKDEQTIAARRLNRLIETNNEP